MLQASSTEEHLFGEEDYFISRLTGFFVPPRTGEYEFLMKADHAGELWFGVDGTSSHLVGKLLDLDYAADFQGTGHYWQLLKNMFSIKTYLVTNNGELLIV